MMSSFAETAGNVKVDPSCVLLVAFTAQSTWNVRAVNVAVIVPAAFIVAVVEAEVGLVILIPVVALHDEN
jgi:uncharacterized membrane protein